MGNLTYGYTFYNYQEDARATAVYPESFNTIYPALGLAEEAGEVCGKLKKTIRQHGEQWKENLDIPAITKELGDVLWYVQAIAGDLGISLEEVAQENIKKLRDRFGRGVIKGEGDNR